MKEFRFWLTASFFSVFIHFFIIAVLAFSGGLESKSETSETIAVNIELLNIPPALEETAHSENLPEQARQSFVEPKKDIPLIENKPITPPTAQVLQPPVQPMQQVQPQVQSAQSPVQPAQPSVQQEQTPIISSASATGANNISTTQAGTEGISANSVPASGGTKTSKGGGRGDKKAYPTYAPMPQYPLDARTDKVEGRVYIRVFLDETGKVLDAQITKSSGSTSLDQSALSCLRNWKFAPTYRAGIPVADRIIVPVVFNMRQN